MRWNTIPRSRRARKVYDDTKLEWYTYVQQVWISANTYVARVCREKMTAKRAHEISKGMGVEWCRKGILDGNGNKQEVAYFA